MKLAIMLFSVILNLLNLNCASNQLSLEELDHLDCHYALRIGTNLGQPGPVLEGQYYSIYIFLDSIGQAPLREFNLTLAYDTSVLYLGTVEPAKDISCWDDFEYNITSEYTKNLINISASSSIGSRKKDYKKCAGESGIFETIPVKLVRLNFLVKSNDDTNFKPFLPISFYWQDCESNVISTVNPQIKFVAGYVSPIRELLPYENDYYLPALTGEVTDNHLLGTLDDCIERDLSNEIAVRKEVSFINGGIYAEMHDRDREIYGDLDFDYLACSVKDLLLFADYFIYGDSVFTIDRKRQYMASDVNRDRIVLTLSDFVYILRIMSGDALANNKLRHLEYSSSIYLANDTLYVESNTNLGAVYFSVYGNSEPDILLDGLTVKTDYVDGCHIFLIYEGDVLNSIHAGKVPLLRFDTNNMSITFFEAAGYNGEMVNSIIKR